MLAWLIAAIVVWWRARAGGDFYIIGMEGAWSESLGPLLPAICAGITAALTLSIVDAASTPFAGIAAAIVVLILPGFVPLHSTSLAGPPLLTLTLATLAVMLHAPRFSLAYGTLAAVVAVYVAPAGIGLPVAAVAWAFLSGSRGSRSPVRRVAFALVPLLVLALLSHWTGNGWPVPGSIEWRGGLDRGFRVAGTVIGNQLTPGIHNSTLRWLAIADISLMLIAVVVVAWRRVARSADQDSALRRLYPAAGVLALSYSAGLAAHSLLLTGVTVPDLAAIFPLVVLALLVTAVSMGVLWPRWSKVGKVIALILIAGWAQAAIRG